jgi:chaperonin GroES
MIPIRNNILFKPFLSDAVSAGGIIVPDSARKHGSRGVIVKTGKGTADRPMKLKEGQIAYRVDDWGTEIIIGNEKYFLMDSNAVLAVE